MAGVSESHRTRIAFILLGIGLVFVLLGFALLGFNAATNEPGTPTTHPTTMPVSAKARVLQQTLFYTVLLVLVFAISTIAFLRWSRHFRRSLLRKPQAPTPSEDVWAMHKLPAGAVEEWTDPNPPDGSDSPQ